MSTRTFYRRGQKIEIEQLDDVVAMPVPEGQADVPAGAAPEPAALADAVKTTPMAGHDAEAFRRAGWMIVETPQADALAGAAGQPDADSSPVFRDAQQGRLLIGTRLVTVKFKPDVPEATATQRLADSGLTVLRRLGFAKNLFQAEAQAGKDPLDVAAALQESADVEYAEPEMIEHLPGRIRPTDPQYPRQWQWHNDGSLGGQAQADVRAETAWESGRGAGVRVAVIDNGFDVEHVDLSPVGAGSAHFVRTPNGDAVLRRDLVGFPDSNHGTFCAGMVGAHADNAKGGCGAAPEAELMLIACLNDQVGTQATLARAVAYAADPTLEPAGAGMAGADVIACSLGPNNAPWAITSVMDDALTFAATQGRAGKGIAIFWAVDNAPNPVANDQVCSHETTIAVGRSTRADRENGSAFGPELDFLAPGVDVFSTNSGDGFGTSTGTSFAAPCAAGVAALLVAAKPEATPAEIRKAMRDTCKKIGGVQYTNGRHDKYGFGRIDAARALESVTGVGDAQGDVQDDEMPAAAAAGPVAIGPQLPTEEGSGESRWTAPSLITVKLNGKERELEVSVLDGRAVFEGDIVLTRGLESLGIVHSDVGRRWPNRQVIYAIAPTLPQPERVTKAIAHWEDETDISFKKREQEANYVYFRPGASCSSAVGMIGGVQHITLASTCSVGNVIHEIGHAVGLWHEQSREDRDTKVTIRWENIPTSAHHNFRQQIQDGDDVGAYDYGSIMHYSANAFSINGQPTIVPKQDGVLIGQREKLSDGDISTVEKMYENI